VRATCPAILILLDLMTQRVFVPIAESRLAVVFYIEKVPCSSLETETVSSDVFSGFPQSLQENAGIVPTLNRPRPPHHSHSALNLTLYSVCRWEDPVRRT
jgi:hypothetical protein